MQVIKIKIVILFFIIISLNSFSLSSYHRGIAVVIGDIVYIRAFPLANGEIVGTIRENEIVKILDWSNEEYKIGKFKDKWSRIRTSAGLEGYVFGAFIFDIEDLYFWEWSMLLKPGTGLHLTFKRDRNYELIKFIKDNRNRINIIKRVKGRFDIQGCKIVLNNNLIKELYMYRSSMKGVKKVPVSRMYFDNTSALAALTMKKYPVEYALIKKEINRFGSFNFFYPTIRH